MDFIEKLLFLSSYNTILVIVNQLSKQVIFVNIITLHKLVKLFIIYVFSKHSILFHITSDCGSKFVSNFFRSLETALNIRLHFTSRYHLKGDSQNKHTNQTLELYFCIYYNYQQDNWLDLLLLAEFAYNSTPSATTSISLFFTNKDYYPSITIYPEKDITLFYAYEFTVDFNKLQDVLKTEIFAIQQWYQQLVDVYKISGLNFQIGQQIFIKV